MSKYSWVRPALIAGAGLYNYATSFRGYSSSDSPTSMAYRSTASGGTRRRGRPRRRARFSLRLKNRTSARVTYKKRRFKSKRSFINKKRKFRRRKAFLKKTLSAQPWWIDSAVQAGSSKVEVGTVSTLGAAPIGVWTGGTSSTNMFPYPNTADLVNQYGDLTRIAAKLGLYDGSTSTFLDNGQKILINYSKVQYNIRNNTNIALNLRIFQFRPRVDSTALISSNRNFNAIWEEALLHSRLQAHNVSPLTHPTDLPYFTERFTIISQKNIRLLPGQNKYISAITCKNKLISSNRLNQSNFYRYMTKYVGILFNGDPVHETIELPVSDMVSNSDGRIDYVVSYKLKFRRLDAPTIQNHVHLDNDLDQTSEANWEHVAAFADTVTAVDH